MADDALARDPLAGEPAWAAYGALVTAAFVAAAIFGFGGRPLTMAVGAGAAALVAASARVATVAGVVALVGVTPAAAASIGGGRGRELVAALAVLVALGWTRDRLLAAVAALGVVLLGAGVAVGRLSGDAARIGLDAGDSTGAAVLLALSAVVLVFVAVAPTSPGPLAVVLVPGTLAGFAAAGGAVAPQVTVAVAGVIAVVAVTFDRPAASLAGLAVAVSAGLDEPAITGLLAASAVLVAAFPLRAAPFALVTAVPGLAGLAAAVAANPTPRAAGAAAFAAVCAAAAVLRIDGNQWSAQLAPALWPAAVLAAWLVAAPQTWGWLGAVPDPVLVSSRALAAAGALVAVMLTASAAAGRLATLRR